MFSIDLSFFLLLSDLGQDKVCMWRVNSNGPGGDGDAPTPRISPLTLGSLFKGEIPVCENILSIYI